MKPIFCVNNRTPSIINTRYEIFMSSHCVYSISKPINLPIFQNPFTSRLSPFLVANITFFWQKCLKILWQKCFIAFIDCFAFNFSLVSLGLIWLLLVLVIFSWSCCSFLSQNELVMVSNFPLRRFVRLANLSAHCRKTEIFH